MKTLLATLALAALATPVAAYDYRTSGNSPIIVAPDGTYLGNLNANRYDPNSIANPYGTYGSRYSPNSVNNPYGAYVNPYSSLFSKPYGRR